MKLSLWTNCHLSSVGDWRCNEELISVNWNERIYWFTVVLVGVGQFGTDEGKHNERERREREF